MLLTLLEEYQFGTSAYKVIRVKLKNPTAMSVGFFIV